MPFPKSKAISRQQQNDKVVWENFDRRAVSIGWALVCTFGWESCGDSGIWRIILFVVYIRSTTESLNATSKAKNMRGNNGEVLILVRLLETCVKSKKGKYDIELPCQSS